MKLFQLLAIGNLIIIIIISIIYCYTTAVLHDTYMYIHKNIQLRNTEYKSTRKAQYNVKPNNLCKSKCQMLM